MGNYFKMKEVIKDRKDNVVTLAKELGMLPATFRKKIENGALGAEVCMAIVDRYQMSLLETLEVFSTKPDDYSYQTSDPFTGVLRRHGGCQRDLGELLGMQQTCIAWKKRRRNFRVSEINKIAVYYDLTAEEIVEMFELKKGC